MKGFLTIFSICFLIIFHSNAEVWEVRTDIDGFSANPLSFRQALSNSTNGDTIHINVAGGMNMGSDVVISKNITILGPAPIHFTFYSNAGTGSFIIQNTVYISDVKFADKPSGQSLIIVNSAAANLTLERCLIKDVLNGTTNGPAMDVANGSVDLISCSIANNFGSNGGAISVHSTGSLNAYSCSFINNQANANGGAISYETNARGTIAHCTFYNNLASNLGGGVYAGVTGSGQVNFESCLFDPSNTSLTNGDNVYSIGFNVNTLGSNMMDDNNGCPQFIDGTNGDMIGGGYTFGLRPAGPVTDGYGLLWIPITEQTSDAIGNGTFSSYFEDNRRAPRTLPDLPGQAFGNTDIGAVEFTTLRVTQWVGPNDLSNAISAYNSAGGENYISFDLSSNADFTSAPPPIAGFSTDRLIIDGFTQETSVVPGPANASNQIQAGHMPVSFDLSGGDCITYDGAAGSVSGLSFRNGDHGVVVTFNTLDEVHIFGNYFGLETNGNGNAGVFLNGHGISLQSANGHLVGGHANFERNVFGNVNLYGVHNQSCTDIEVINNFFGTDGIGINSTNLSVSSPGAVGAFANSQNIFVAGNLIGGLSKGVWTTNSDGIFIHGNRIGYAYDNTAMIMDAEGIILENRFGGPFEIFDNIIGNCNVGIFTRDLLDSPGIDIKANLIGVDEANNVHSNNSAGIILHNSEDAVIGGSIADDRNVITGNTGIGIKLESNTNQVYIESNFIGTDVSGLGNASFNLSNGIWIDSSFVNFIGHELAEPNIIINAQFNGIWSVASNNNRFINNRIGADKDGNAFGNNNGINFVNSSNNQIGDINPNQGNLIANSTNNGISVSEGGQNIFTRDSIFNNGALGFELYNNTSDNEMFVNWIYGNGAGISIFGTGSNQYDIETPTIIAASQCGADVRVVTDLASTSGDIRFEYYTIPNGLQHGSGFGEGNYPEVLVGPITIPGPTHSQLDAFTSIHGAGDYVSCLISSFDGTYYNTSEFSNHMQIAGPVAATITSADDVTCHGDFDGIVYFDITGGSGPYNIEIINSLDIQEATQGQSNTGSFSFTNMYPETYRIVVEDVTGCRDTSNTITVNEPAQFDIINPSVTDETCPGSNDGTIDISLATGGTGALQFSIDGGISYQASGNFTNLAPGTYIPALMDANGCDSVFTGFPLVVNPGVDATNPTITCPANQSVSLDASCSYTLMDYTGMATATDNCGSVTVTQVPTAGTVITSTTTITLTADDGNGNTANCTFDVIPSDNTNPTITCPGNQNVSFDATCLYTLPDYTGLAVASDNCGAPTVTQSPSIGTSISGTTTITLTATDGSGNTATCTFDVIPADNTNPTITCPSNQNAVVDGTCNYSLADFTSLAVASDNCGTPTLSQSPTPGTSLGLGTHTITITATDGGGNTASCNFDVVVSDTLAPTITCPGNQSASLDASCEFVLPDYSGLVTASDNCGTPTITQSPLPGTIFNGESTQTITMTATYGGLSSNCTFDVVISDLTPPSITCPGNQNEPLDASCSFTLPNYSSLAVASDNCGIDTITQLPAPGTIISGTTTITLTAVDNNGLTSSCNFDVIPTDQTNPIAICQNITVVLDNSGNATILASDLDNGSSDNCTPAASLTFSATQTSFSCADLNMGNMGSVSVDLTVEDAAGNQSQCTATVTVDGSSIGILDAGNDQTICQELAGTIGNSYTGPNTSFSWSTVNGTGFFVPTNTLSSVYYPGNGEIGLITLVLTASGTCPTVTDTVIIDYLEAPSLTVSGTDENCNLSDGSITITGSGAGGAYEYSFDGGTTWTTSNVATGLSAGIYNLQIRDAATQCSRPEVYTINNIQGVQWDATLATDVSCNGANDGSFEGTTINPLYNHNYILNPGGVSQPNDSLFTNLGAGSYEAIVIAANGCSDTVTFLINEPAPIALNFTITDYCLPAVGEIIASASGGSAPYEYSDDGVNFSTADTFSDLIPGTYTIYAKGANGCTTDSTVSVGGTLLLPPTINSGGNYCEDGIYNASGSSSTGADSLIWFNNINPLDTLIGSSVSLWNYLADQDSVFLTYQENGCLGFPIGIEVVIENNTLDAGPDIVICPGDSGILNATHGTGAFKWLNNEVNDPFNPITQISLNNDGYAIASLQTASCYFTDSAFVDVDDSNPDCGLGVANAFSPNGDGINDTWYIQAVEDHLENTVIIVNRWGDEIIRIENYDNNSNAWNGLLQNGSLATEGTYFYIIELKDIDQQISGWIQITN